MASKYSPKNVLEQEPAVISGAVVVVGNALALFNAVTVSTEQLAAVNVAVATVLALFTRQAVTPNAKL